MENLISMRDVLFPDVKKQSLLDHELNDVLDMDRKLSIFCDNLLQGVSDCSKKRLRCILVNCLAYCE